MKYRRTETSHLSRSPSSSLPCKFSRIPDDKSRQLMNGALSPLHTRRGPLNDLVTPTPDFAEFDYLQECPKLLAVTSDEDCQNVAVAFSDLDKLQVELEQILIHTTDHQKKIYGEITFLTTGDYPSDDISRRLMPVYDLKISEPLPACSKEIEREPIVEDLCTDGEINWLDESFDVWPPINLSQKFWIFAREYLDPIDEEYLQQWWSNIVHLFINDDISKSPSQMCPVTEKKSTNCDTLFHGHKINSLPSYSKWDTSISLHRNRSFICSKNMSSPVRLKLLNNDSSPPPNKIARYEIRSPSQSPGKTLSLLDDLISAYVNGKNDGVDNHYNGVLPKLEKKNCFKKDSVSLVQLESNDWMIKNEEVGREDIFQVAHSNGLASEENGSIDCGDTLEMLNYALADYLSRFDKEFDTSKCNKVIQELIGSEDVEELVGKCMADKKHNNEDEVSALKKLQAEFTEKAIPWRSIVAKIWHRLLAEYLRMKLEQALDKADQEMFEVYDKYYSEFPRRRPMNGQEREECRCVLQRRNDVAQAYYGKEYAALSKWKHKVGCVKDLKFDMCPKNKGLDRNSEYKMCLIKNIEFCCEYEIGS
ncbi:Mechanosensory protein [Dirofilaria immitis]